MYASGAYGQVVAKEDAEYYATASVSADKVHIQFDVSVPVTDNGDGKGGKDELKAMKK